MRSHAALRPPPPNDRPRHRVVRVCIGRGIGLAMAAALAVSAPVAAQVYKCVDTAGSVTYQESPCPTAAKGGRVELFVDNGSSRGTADDEAQWQSAAREHTVIVGMPRRYVLQALGAARELRRGRPGDNAAEVWSYSRADDVLRIGFANGVVAWQRVDPPGADLPPAEDARAAARSAVARGQNCDQVLSDLGNATSDGQVPTGPDAAVRRYVWEPAPGDARTRTTVVCVNGLVTEVERLNVR